MPVKQMANETTPLLATETLAEESPLPVRKSPRCVYLYFLLLALVLSLFVYSALSYWLIPSQISSAIYTIENKGFDAAPAKFHLSTIQINAFLNNSMELHAQGFLSQKIAPVNLYVRPFRVRISRIDKEKHSNFSLSSNFTVAGPEYPQPHWIPFSQFSSTTKAIPPSDSTSDPEKTNWTVIDDQIFAQSLNSKRFPPILQNSPRLLSLSVPQIVFPDKVDDELSIFIRLRLGEFDADGLSEIIKVILETLTLDASRRSRTITTRKEIFWLQAEPRIDVNLVGAWRVPYWKYLLLDPDSISFDTKQFNVSRIHTSYKFVNQFPNPPTLVFTLIYSLTNPYPLSILPQNISISCIILYEGKYVLDSFIPHDSFALNTRTPQNFTVSGNSVKGGTSKLLKMIEKLAAGEEVVVVAKQFLIGYEGDRERLGWVENMIRNWEIPLVLRADEDSLTYSEILRGCSLLCSF
ncbi:hypothetical protein HK098_005291 [Nowakowskiella sp. JEL0407]|nr:hypothetical protein HK098_005291 [Nowakowskiella sp. JEL0407]